MVRRFFFFFPSQHMARIGIYLYIYKVACARYDNKKSKKRIKSDYILLHIHIRAHRIVLT